ncbi:MAG: undecaprenyl-phosphate glucose phosphotransferase [Fimbriimonadaceae bacterium]|nr:undecaprenyl-phosphate glucose phosphotransferase [Alphaproteobacteria bacterium]
MESSSDDFRMTADRILAASISEAETVNSKADRRKNPRLGELARRIASQNVANSLSPVVVAGSIRIAEFLLNTLLGAAIFALYLLPAESSQIMFYASATIAISFVTTVIFEIFDLYNIQSLRYLFSHAGRVGAAWSISFALTLAVVFFTKLGDEFSRVWLASWYLSGLCFFSLFRVIMSMMVRKWTREGRLERRAVIVGGGPNGENLIKALEASTNTDIRICGVFDDRSDERSPRVIAGYPKLGTISELVEFARRTRIDLLIVSIPVKAENRVIQLLKKLWVLPVDIRLSAHSNKLRFRPRSYSYIGNVPFLDVFDKPMADWDYVGKTIFDRVIGMLMLILLAPVMAAVAIAIKLDSKGPVLFKQKRYGFNNELIEVYKFRSMYTDQSDAKADRLVTKDDPRVTPVGRFIRKTSLDELPQLFNVVFKRNLSLVGPRPHAVHAKAADDLYDHVVDGYYARHRVIPGITGWAQINGWRGETDTPEKIERRVEHDLYYIENWSLMLDFYILFMTPFSLISNENAY